MRDANKLVTSSSNVGTIWGKTLLGLDFIIFSYDFCFAYFDGVWCFDGEHCLSFFRVDLEMGVVIYIPVIAPPLQGNVLYPDLVFKDSVNYVILAIFILLDYSKAETLIKAVNFCV